MEIKILYQIKNYLNNEKNFFTNRLSFKKKRHLFIGFFNKQNNNNHVINIEPNHYKLNNQARKLENKLQILFSKLNNIHQKFKLNCGILFQVIGSDDIQMF